jgi:hypothetical protein
VKCATALRASSTHRVPCGLLAPAAVGAPVATPVYCPSTLRVRQLIDNAIVHFSSRMAQPATVQARALRDGAVAERMAYDERLSRLQAEILAAIGALLATAAPLPHGSPSIDDLLAKQAQLQLQSMSASDLFNKYAMVCPGNCAMSPRCFPGHVPHGKHGFVLCHGVHVCVPGRRHAYMCFFEAHWKDEECWICRLPGPCVLLVDGKSGARLVVTPRSKWYLSRKCLC